jgi:hypothetical protein
MNTNVTRLLFTALFFTSLFTPIPSLALKPFKTSEIKKAQIPKQFCSLTQRVDPALVQNPQIRPRNYLSPQEFCSGTIAINRRSIVTAAHCFDDLKLNPLFPVLKIEARCNADKEVQVVKGVEISAHFTKQNVPNYGVFARDDLAVVKVDADFSVDPIKIVPSALTRMKFMKNGPCAIFGYGSLESAGAWVNIISMAEALQIIPGDPFLKNAASVYVGRQFIADFGDSGGPLLCFEKNAWNLIGVLSTVHTNSAYKVSVKDSSGIVAELPLHFMNVNFIQLQK